LRVTDPAAHAALAAEMAVPGQRQRWAGLAWARRRRRSGPIWHRRYAAARAGVAESSPDASSARREESVQCRHAPGTPAARIHRPAHAREWHRRRGRGHRQQLSFGRPDRRGGRAKLSRRTAAPGLIGAAVCADRDALAGDW